MEKKNFYNYGGTGGHIIPAIALCKFKKRGHIVEIISDKEVKNF